MTGKQPRDEGAAQTGLIVEAVRRRRNALGWSAQQLADEMTKAGVPWNADIVVNLEHGRRKSLRVHEFMALAWVLDADSPLDLLGPPDVMFYPVTPRTYMRREAVRAWWMGETGPLRKTQAGAVDARELAGLPADLPALFADLPADLQQELVRLVLSLNPVPRRPAEGNDDGQD